MKLSQFLRQKRIAKGLSQRDVADELGYTSAQFVSNIERGLSSPPLKKLNTIVKLYGINPRDLYNIMLEDQKTTLYKAIFKKQKR